MNPYHKKTAFTSRPARNDPKWRYVDEGALVQNQDLWDCLLYTSPSGRCCAATLRARSR